MNATASTIDVTLKGKEYELKPLSLVAMGNVSNWVRGSLIASARSSCDEQLPKVTGKERDDTIKLAMLTAQGVQWLDKHGMKATRTLPGTAKLLHESLKPTTAGITFDKCCELIQGSKPLTIDLEAYESFYDKFFLVNDMILETEETEGGETEFVSFRRNDSKQDGTPLREDGDAANGTSKADTDTTEPDPTA